MEENEKYGQAGGTIELRDSDSDEAYDLGTDVSYEIRALTLDPPAGYHGEIRCKLSPDRRSTIAEALSCERQRRANEPSYRAFRVLEMLTFAPDGLWQQFDYADPQAALSPVSDDGFSVVSFETMKRVRVG